MDNMDSVPVNGLTPAKRPAEASLAHKGPRLVTGAGIRLAATAIAFLVLACSFPPGNGGDPPATPPDNAEPSCFSPNQLTAQTLPQPKTPGLRILTNPCLPRIGALAGAVVRLIPAEHQSRAGKFISGIGKIAERLDILSDLAECGYQTNQIAITIYSDENDPSSIGVVLAFRGGGADVLLDGAKCFLDKRIPISGIRLAASGLAAAYCLDSAPHFGADPNTTVWLGSSELMCQDLTSGFSQRLADASFGTARTPIKIRSGASTRFKEVAALPSGSYVLLECFTLGEAVPEISNSDRWVRVKVSGATGYVYEPLLEVKIGKTAYLPRCPEGRGEASRLPQCPRLQHIHPINERMIMLVASGQPHRPVTVSCAC